MQKLILSAAILLTAHSAFAQATVIFNNLVTGILVAPVYGIEPANPTLGLHGNTALGVPAGTTVYTGSLLSGTDFTVSLWGLGSDSFVGNEANNNLQFIAATTFRTGSAAGFINISGLPGGNPTVAVPAAPLIEGQRGTFQVRAWQTISSGGNTWADAVNQGVANGSSLIFSPSAPLGGTPSGIIVGETPAPFLRGLTSFNIAAVPEPSVWALGVLGAAALLWRRRKSR